MPPVHVVLQLHKAVHVEYYRSCIHRLSQGWRRGCLLNLYGGTCKPSNIPISDRLDHTVGLWSTLLLWFTHSTPSLHLSAAYLKCKWVCAQQLLQLWQKSQWNDLQQRLCKEVITIYRWSRFWRNITTAIQLHVPVVIICITHSFLSLQILRQVECYTSDRWNVTDKAKPMVYGHRIRYMFFEHEQNDGNLL